MSELDRPGERLHPVRLVVCRSGSSVNFSPSMNMGGSVVHVGGDYIGGGRQSQEEGEGRFDVEDVHLEETS
jgi:hypothetical protein